jgi:TonB family protein
MSLPVEIHNLVAFLLQGTLLALGGALLPGAFRIRSPKILLGYWQWLLVFCLVFPLLAPRAPLPAPATTITAGPPAASGEGALLNREKTRAPEAGRPAISWSALVMLLATGWAVRCGMLAMGLLKLRLLRRNSRRFAAALPMETAHLVALLGGTEILIAPDLSSPATYGWIRSRILLPDRFESLEPGAQVSILCHELVHVRRRDWLFALGEHLILALFWFHPAVWWLVRRIELSREQLVDQEVLTLSIDRRQYLKSLLLLVSGRAAWISASLFLTRHHLKERIALLLEDIHMSRMRLFAFLISVVFLLGAGAAAAVRAFPLNGAAAAQSNAPAISPAAAPAPSPAPAPAISPVPPAAVSPAPAPKPVTPTSQAKVVPVAPARPAEPKTPPAGTSPVNGMVLDQDGVPVEGATVKAADPDTKAPLATGVTDERGRFSFSLESGGSLEITAAQDGFKPAVIQGVKLVAAVPTTIKIVLQLDGGATTVVIRAGGQAAASEATPSDNGRARAARVISRVDPAYPPAAREQGIEAVVITELMVDVNGNVAAVRLIKSVPMFDEAAMNAVREWRFSPAQLNGQPHQSRATVTFMFRF